MVAPGFLRNEAVRRWLGCIEPTWRLLDETSFRELSRPPSAMGGPIYLAADFTDEELQKSAVARNALILLRAAATGPGLKVTPTGNLSRSVVAEMCSLFTWPGYDMASDFQYHKVVNEPDFLPLHFVRQTLQAAKLVRIQGISCNHTCGPQVTCAVERIGAASDSVSCGILGIGSQLSRPRPSWPLAAIRCRHRLLVFVSRRQRLANWR
jgi:hypothetical protein